MNIYALEGHKVVCTTLSAGYSYDQETAAKYLEVNKEYIVEYTEVDSWSTNVYLKEFPHIRFNSVFFEDAEQQGMEQNKIHPDFKKFNR